MNIIYTPEQEDAIKHRKGNLLIIACAGSGKTEVISRRIVELVKEGVNRHEIIAFTFTERAAKELKARIRTYMEELQPDDPSLGDMYVGTIHSFCLQLLKDLDPKYRNFEVIEEAQQVALIASNYYYNEKIDRGIGLNVLRSRTKTGSYWDALRCFITTLNVMHQKNITSKQIKDRELRSAVERYHRIVRGKPNYFFDFNGIIDELITILKERPNLLREVQIKFKYLIVDEYQDIDFRQEELIQLISDNGKRLSVTVVGDDDQAIYGWRGANVQNILQFKKRYPNVKEIKLVDNFRSTHVIVEMANSAIRELPKDKRLNKAMEARYPLKKKGEKPKERVADRGDVHKLTFDSDENEASWIVDRIGKLRGTIITEKNGNKRAIDYADMAILLRSVRSSGSRFANALRENDIPVVVKGAGGLFSQDEILLMQAAFCQLARTEFYYTDSEGVDQRVSPDDAREFIRKIIGVLKKNKLMPSADAASFLEWIAEKRAELDKQSLPREERGRLSRRIYPQDIFQEMLQKLKAADGKEPWQPSVLHNLGRFSGLLTAFEAAHQWITPNDLMSLCIFLGGWAAENTDEGGVNELTTPNAVQIMTVHGAKGLEWPVVFLPRISSALFPSSRRNQGPETFLNIKLFNPQEYSSGDDGERRLWYVALTRCQKFLHVSSQDRPKKRPTDYFKDIKHDFVHEDGKDPIKREKGTPTPPANTELMPTTYSDLNYFWHCQFEYQLRCLMGFKPGVKEAYGYGQQIHNILAEIHKVAQEGKKITEKLVSNLVEERFNLRYTTAKPLELLRKAAKRSLIRYINEFKDQANYVLEYEKSFEYMDRESGALITGTIDLLEHIEGGSEKGQQEKKPVCVIDFKTHNWREISEYLERKNDVEKQLKLYAAAVKNALGFDPRSAAAYFLSPKELSRDLVKQGAVERLKVDVSESEQKNVMREVKNAVVEIKSGIERGNLFQRTGCSTGRCKKCDFRMICPGYKTWRKKDNSTPNPLSFDEERENELRDILEDVDADSPSK